MAFAGKGAKCVLCSRSSDLEQIVEEIKARGGEAVGIMADISEEQTARKLASAALSNYDTIDIWVNNAGIIGYSAIDFIEREKMVRMFEVNTFGTIYCCKEALLNMKPQRSGHIINIISTAGKEGKVNESVYVATKFAVAGFTETLCEEAHPYGIRVTGIYTGGMRTHLFDNEHLDKDINTFMDPKEVAGLVVYIANLPEDMAPKEIVVKRMKD